MLYFEYYNISYTHSLNAYVFSKDTRIVIEWFAVYKSKMSNIMHNFVYSPPVFVFLVRVPASYCLPMQKQSYAIRAIRSYIDSLLQEGYKMCAISTMITYHDITILMLGNCHSYVVPFEIRIEFQMVQPFKYWTLDSLVFR